MPSPKMFDLSARVAVVTGGNGGIGLVIALGLAEAGTAIAILARNDTKNRTALEQLRAFGNPVVALQLDVTRRDALSAVMDHVEEQLGPIDILVNNAGVCGRFAEVRCGQLGSRNRDQPDLMLSAFAACGGFDDQAAHRQDNQYCERILTLR